MRSVTVTCVSSLVIVICVLLLSRYFSYSTKVQKQNAQATAFVARVNDAYLYPADVAFPGATGMEGTERTHLLNQYIEDWACKKLLLIKGKAANAAKNSCLGSTEAQVNQYKEDLIAYSVLTTRVERKLNTSVSEEEIADYYQKHPDDFILNHDIVKGLFVAMPKKAAHIHVIKSLMLSKRQEDYEKLKTYCAPYAATVRLEPAQWLAWEDVLNTVGYRPVGDATRLLRTNKFIHVAGQRGIYFLRIDAYKTAQELEPLESAQERIKSIIVHKRRLALGKKIKESLLQDAKQKKVYVIQPT
jgi:hypothetical protein